MKCVAAKTKRVLLAAIRLEKHMRLLREVFPCLGRVGSASYRNRNNNPDSLK
jgi:hypothetical protein